ncbi:MAG TPA: DMT family transporter [Gemmatales bacterium]|nr:DMT family transporter [Gemmatales bacterium]
MDDALPYAGKLAALAASLIWSCSISLYKAHGQGVPAQTLNLYKLSVALVGFSLILGVMHLMHWHGSLEAAPHFPGTWQKSFWLIASGVIGLTLGDTFFFVSIKHLGAALASALQCLTPPISALIDWLIYDKPMTSIQLVGLAIIVLSVAGVILAGRQGRVALKETHNWNLGITAALCSALCQAIAYAIQGEHLKGENIFACAILRFTPALAILVLLAIFSKTGKEGALFMVRHPKKLFYLALAAIIGTVIGISFLSFAFQHEVTGIVSTLSTTYPIWVIPVAALFLKEHPTPMQIICTILAIVGIALLMIPAEMWQNWLPGKL